RGGRLCASRGHFAVGGGQGRGGGGCPPLRPAVFGVLTGEGRERRLKLYLVQWLKSESPVNGLSPIRLLLRPRDASTHCSDRSCGCGGRHVDFACHARACTDRQYFFRSSAAAARQYSARPAAASPG